jgi:hypothetical protein
LKRDGAEVIAVSDRTDFAVLLHQVTSTIPNNTSVTIVEHMNNFNNRLLTTSAQTFSYRRTSSFPDQGMTISARLKGMQSTLSPRCANCLVHRKPFLKYEQYTKVKNKSA